MTITKDVRQRNKTLYE